MMFGIGWIGMYVHWIFAGLLLFGFIAALLWLYKHGSKRGFLSVVGWSIGIGIIGALLTSPWGGQGFSTMMNRMGCGLGDGTLDEEDWEFMGEMMGEWEDLEDEYGQEVDEDDMLDIMSTGMRNYFEENGDSTLSQGAESEE